MNKFKKVIFPFGDKYKQLNNKWRHRLLKVVYGISIVLFSIGTITYLNSDLSVPSFNTMNEEEIREWEGVLGSFIANIDQGDDITVIREKYPELANLDDYGIGQLIANIDQGDDVKTIMSKYPELSDDIPTIHSKGINYILYYFEYIFLFIIFVSVYNVIVQLFYYKGIIYIIYGDKDLSK